MFDILVSYYDIFNILKLTESLNDSYCMVCYPSLAEKARNYYMSTEVIPAPAVTGTPEESTQRIVSGKPHVPVGANHSRIKLVRKVSALF